MRPAPLVAALSLLAALPLTATRAKEVPAAEPAAASAPAGGAEGEVRVVMHDGQVLRGRLVARDASTLTLEMAGARLSLPASAVREVASATGARGGAARDPNRTRYLYSPSAFLLRQGEGYLSQTQLFVTSVAVGATDWLTLQAGTVLPVLFYAPTMTPFVVAVKAGGPVGGGVHLAGGFQTAVIPGLSAAPAVGILFGTLTLGDEDRHVSLSAGPPFLLSKSSSALGAVLVSLSGAVRVSPSFALVTDNWLIPVDGRAYLVGSAALRFITDRLGIDAGFVFFEGAGVPLPWLDFSWHWR